MSLKDFQESPWHKQHSMYRDSPFVISPAPEYASSEVLVASLFRTIGFANVAERSVPQAGRTLDQAVDRRRQRQQSSPDGAVLDPTDWYSVLHGVLESPKLPNQSSQRFIQVTPLVPETALFSNTPRLKGNSWNAGPLVRAMVVMGTPDRAAAELLWKDLFEALSVTESDDIFARWLQSEVQVWTPPHEWSFVPIPDAETRHLAAEDDELVTFLPARRFAADLRSVISAKPQLTRRQWMSLVEAIIRMGASTHIAWLCDIHDRIWRTLKESADDIEPSSSDDVRERVFPRAAHYMAYRGKALNGVKDRSSAYLAARLGINTMLWALEEAGVTHEGNLGSAKGIMALCQSIKANRDKLDEIRAMDCFHDLVEQEARALHCANGIGKNLVEFARHVLGQRQAAIPLLRGYDQGYALCKSGSYSNSPWTLSLGPVAVLAMVHCALHGMGGPRSVHRLAEHLAEYGVIVNRNDIGQNDLGQQLRMLGLLLDSPDAESGMLLLPPFAPSNHTAPRP